MNFYVYSEDNLFVFLASTKTQLILNLEISTFLRYGEIISLRSMFYT